MKRTDLIKQLRKIAKEEGVALSEVEGGSHTKVYIGSWFVTVPRHKEINEMTARAIIKDARGEANG